MLRVLFVGGLGRSGSTLVERLLGELPGVRALGEVVHLWERGLLADERCGCGEPFHGCRFWQQVGAVAFGGWDRLDASRLLSLKASVDRTRFLPRLAVPRPGASFRREVEEYVAHYTRLYAAAREVTGAEMVVDSSKHASLAYCLRWAPDVDLRVLHVVRDSRAVAYSWTKQVSRPEAAGDVMATYTPGRAAVHWNTQNLAFGLLGRIGTPTHLVRYEDFVRAPEAELRRAAQFAGVQPDDAALPVSGDQATLTAAHTVSGNPMRFQAGPITVRHDEAWRSNFPASSRVVVSACTLPLRIRYGYHRRDDAG